MTDTDLLLYAPGYGHVSEESINKGMWHLEAKDPLTKEELHMSLQMHP